jgi:hypothetical protein
MVYPRKKKIRKTEPLRHPKTAVWHKIALWRGVQQCPVFATLRFLFLKTMKTTFIAYYGDKKYVIEPDLPEVGAYLRIYEGGRDSADYLQDSIEACKCLAHDDFGIPIDSWIEVRSPCGVVSSSVQCSRH